MNRYEASAVALRWAVWPVLGTLALSGCRLWEGADAYFLSRADHKDYRLAAWQLDEATKALDEFGSISLSMPLLVAAKSDNNPFKFDLNRDAKAFFESAQKTVEGAAAREFESQFALRAALSGRVDLTTLANAPVAAARAAEQELSYHRGQSLRRGAALADLQTALSRAATQPSADQPALRDAAFADYQRALAANEATTQPALPESEAGKLPDVSKDEPPKAESGAIGSAFAAAGGLLPKDFSPQLRDRIALNIAAGDVATNGIFKVLSAAQDFANKDQLLYFGTSMVNVDPGWRTKQDFLADISVTGQYGWKTAGGMVIEQRIEVLLDLKKRLLDASKPVPADLANELVLLGSVFQGATSNGTQNVSDTSSAPLSASRITTSIVPTNRLTRRTNPNKLEFFNDTIYGEDVEPKSSARDELEAVTDSLTNLPPKALRSAAQASLPRTQTPLDAELTTFMKLTPIPPSLAWTSPDTYPQVMAISPMTDVQTLDLSDANRQRSEFALQLSAALQAVGAAGEAKTFASYAEQLQNDVRTRSAVPSVTAYANPEGVFGFRVGPQLRALADAARRDTGAANVLERQTFPVLLLFGLNKDMLKLRYGYDIDAAGNAIVRVYEPQLLLSQTPRWSRLERAYLPYNRMSELDRADYALTAIRAHDRSSRSIAKQSHDLHLLTLDNAARTAQINADDAEVNGSANAASLRKTAKDAKQLATHARNLQSNSPFRTLPEEQADSVTEQQDDVSPDETPLLHQTRMLLQRTRAVSTQLVGSTAALRLPQDQIAGKLNEVPDVAPQVSALLPATMPYKNGADPAPLTFTVIGRTLDALTVETLPDGQRPTLEDAAHPSKQPTGPAAQMEYKPKKDQTSVIFLFKHKDAIVNVTSVTLEPLNAKPDTDKPAAKQSVSVERKTDAAGTRTDTYTADPNNAELLKQLIAGEAAKAGNTDVKVSVQATDNSKK